MPVGIVVAQNHAIGSDAESQFDRHQRFINELRDFLKYAKNSLYSENKAEARYLLGALYEDLPDQLRPKPRSGYTTRSEAQEHYQEAQKAGTGHIGACERSARALRPRDTDCESYADCQTRYEDYRKALNNCWLVPVTWERKNNVCYATIGEHKRCDLPTVLFDDRHDTKAVISYEPEWNQEHTKPPWVELKDDGLYVKPDNDAYDITIELRATRYGHHTRTPYRLTIAIERPTIEKLAYPGYGLELVTGWGLPRLLPRTSKLEATWKSSDMDVLYGVMKERLTPSGLVLATTLAHKSLNDWWEEMGEKSEKMEQLQANIGLIAPIFQLALVVIVKQDQIHHVDNLRGKRIAVVGASPEVDETLGGPGLVFHQIFGARQNETPGYRNEAQGFETLREAIKAMDRSIVAGDGSGFDAIFVLSDAELKMLASELGGRSDTGYRILPLPANMLDKANPSGLHPVRIQTGLGLVEGNVLQTLATELWWVGCRKNCMKKAERCQIISKLIDNDMLGRMRGGMPWKRFDENGGRPIRLNRQTSLIQPQLRKLDWKYSRCVSF
jgi:hypothetical protein